MNTENEMERRLEEVEAVEMKVGRISKDELRKGLERMKAVCLNDIPAGIWRCLGQWIVEWLTKPFKMSLDCEMMTEECRKSLLVLIFQDKGNLQSCISY